TTTPAATTTTSATSRSLPETAKDELNNLADALNDAAAAGSQARHRRDVEALMDPKRQKRQTIISIQVIITIKVKIIQWSVSFARISWNSIDEIRSTTQSVRVIEQRLVSNEITISTKQISVMKSALKVTVKLVGVTVKVIASEKRESQLQVTQTAISSTQTTVASLLASFQSIQASTLTISVEITVIQKIIVIMQSIISFGMSSITQEVSVKLSEYLTLIESSSTTGGSMSTELMNEITSAVTILETASAAITVAQAQSESKISAEAQSKRTEELSVSLAIVKEKISSITSLERSLTETATVSNTAVSVTSIVEVLNILLVSFESVTQEQIDIISAFESQADSIISQLEQNIRVVITGFKSLKSLSAKLGIKVTQTQEEASAQALISEKVETASQVSYYIESFTSILQDIQTTTSSATTVTTESRIQEILTFVTELDVTKLTLEIVTQFQSYLVIIEEIQASVSSSSSIEGVDQLLVSVSSVSESLVITMEELHEKEEKLIMTQQIQTMTQLTVSVQTVVTQLTALVSSTSTEVLSDTSILETITLLREYLTTITSQTYTVVQEDITKIETALQTFQQQASSITVTVNNIRGLTDLKTITKTAVSAMRDKQESFQRSLEIKQSLETLDYIEFFLFDLNELLSEIVTSSSSSTETSINFIVQEMQTQLTQWSNGVLFVKMSSVDVMYGFYESILSLATTTTQISGVAELQSLVTSLSVQVEEAITRIESKDMRFEFSFRTEETLDLISYSLESFQILMEYSAMASGSEVVYEEVSNVTSIIDYLSKRINNISSTDVELFSSAVIILEQFLSRVETGEITIQVISGLAASITQIQTIKKSFQTKVGQEESSTIDILETVQEYVSEITILMESLAVNVTDAGDDAENETLEIIDDIYYYLQYLQENSVSISTQDLLELEMFKEELQVIVDSVDDFTVISGFEITIEVSLILLAELTETFSSSIVLEMQMIEVTESYYVSLDFVYYVEEIIYSLQVISEASATAVASSADTTIITDTLQGLSSNVSDFTDMEAIFTILDTLWEIEDNEQSLDNVQELFALASTTLASVHEFVVIIESQYYLMINSRQIKVVTQVINIITNELNIIMESATSEMFAGERNEDFDILIEYFERLIVNSDSVTVEDAYYMLEIFEIAMAAIYEGEGSGNLIELFVIAQEAQQSAISRRTEQEDRIAVEEAITGTEMISAVLEEIQITLTALISSVTSQTISGSPVDIPEVTNLLMLLEMFMTSSTSQVSIEELQGNLTALQGVTLDAGVEVTGLFRLQTMVEESITTIRTESQFLVFTRESRQSIDFLSRASGVFEELEFSLQDILFHYSNVEGAGRIERSFTLEYILSMLEEIRDINDLSYSFISEIQFLIEDLYGIFSISQIDITFVNKVLEMSRKTSLSVNRALHEVRITSENRQTVTMLSDTVEAVSSTTTFLEDIILQAGGENGTTEATSMEEGEDFGNEQVTELVYFLWSMSLSITITERQMTTLETFIESVAALDMSVFVGDVLIGLQRASAFAVIVQQRVESQLTFAQKTVRLSVKKTTITRAMTVIERIIMTVSMTIKNIGLVTTEVENSDISQIFELLSNVTIETITVEQLSELESKLVILESLDVAEGTGIIGLRQLKSVATSIHESATSSRSVLVNLNTVSETRQLMERTSTTVSEVEMALQSITASDSASESETSESILELQELLSMDMSSYSARTLTRIRQITEIIRRTEITVSMTMITQIFSSITMIQRRIQRRMSRLEIKTTKLMQTETFVQTRRVMQDIFDITQELAMVDGEVDESGEYDQVIIGLITHLTRYRRSIIDIDDTALSMLLASVGELRLILGRGIRVREIENLVTVSETIIQSTTMENEIIALEIIREERLAYSQMSQSAVSNTLKVFEMIVEITGGDSTPDSTEEGEEVSLLEVERAADIIIMIQEGSATEDDLRQLITYSETLEEIAASLIPGEQITGIMETIERARNVEFSLEESVIDTSFDVRHSETVYQQRQVNSLLTETLTILDSLMAMQANGTGEESYSNPVFNDIFSVIYGIERKTSITFVTSFQMIVQRLKDVILPPNARIEGIEEVYQATKSASFSLEIGVSKYQTLERTSSRLSTLEQAEFELRRCQRFLRKLTRNTEGGAVGSRTVVEFTEMIEFMKNVMVYTSAEIVILREYVAILETLNDDDSTEGIADLELLMESVDQQRYSVSAEFAETNREQRAEKQVRYTSAGDEEIKRAFRSVTSVRREYVLEEVIEIREVTRFSVFLMYFDITSINAVGIHRLTQEIERVSKAIAEAGEESIAYLSKITDQLSIVTYEANKQLQVRKNVEIERSLVMGLNNAQTAITSTTSQLHSLQQTMQSQDITNYVEVSAITELYNFLISFTFDYRMITEDFGRQLMSFNISDIQVSSGTGITYFSEVTNLIKQFTLTEKHTKKSVKITEKIMIAREFQSSLSRFTKTLESFIFGGVDEFEESEEENSGESSEGSTGSGGSGEDSSGSEGSSEESTGSEDSGEGSTGSGGSDEGSSESGGSGEGSTGSGGSGEGSSGSGGSGESSVGSGVGSSESGGSGEGSAGSGGSDESSTGSEGSGESSVGSGVGSSESGGSGEGSTGSEGSEESSTGSGNSGESSTGSSEGSNESMSSGEGSSEESSGSSEEDSGESGEMDDVDDEDIDPLDMVIDIISLIEEFTSGTINFESELSFRITMIITKFFETRIDMEMVFSRISISYLKKSLAMLHSASATISSSVQILQSSAEVQRSSTTLMDASFILRDIHSSFTMMSSSGKGSSNALTVMTSIQTMLTSFTSVQFITSYEISLLRSYSYELSVASTSEESIDLGEYGDFSSILTSSMETVEIASFSQSALATSSQALMMTSESSESSSSTFTSFTSSSSTTRYSREERETIQDIAKISQRFYILNQFDELLSVTFEVLSELRDLNGVDGMDSSDPTDESSASGGDDGESTEASGSTDDSSESGESGEATADAFDDEDKEEEEDSVLVLSQITQILKATRVNMDTLEFGTLALFAETLKTLRSYVNTSVSVDMMLIEETITYVNYSRLVFNETLSSVASYALVSQSYVNFQETSSLLMDLTETFKNLSPLDDVQGGNVTVNETVIEEVDSLAGYLIQFSLMSSSINEESLLSFRRSFTTVMEAFHEYGSFFTSSFRIMRHFLIESKVTTLQLLEKSASKGAITRSQTEGEYYTISRASTILSNFTSMIHELILAFDGSADVQSSSRGRLEQIIEESIEVASEWGAGRVQQYQITRCEQYLTELSELIVILSGSSSLESLNELEYSLAVAQEGIDMSLDRIDVELQQDHNDAEMDAYYDYFSQLSYYLKGVGVRDMDSHMDNNYTTNITDSSTSTASATFTSDASDSGQVVLYTRASMTAESILMTIPALTVDKYESGYLINVPEVSEFHSDLKYFRRMSYSASREDVRKISKKTLVLFHAVKMHGKSVAQLVRIEEILCHIQITSMKYGHFTMQSYEYSHAIDIFLEASADIDNALESLSFVSKTRNSEENLEHIEDDSITRAFSFLVGLTSNLKFLPRDLGHIISSFNMSSLNLTYGQSIRYSSEVYHLLIMIKETQSRLTVSHRYLEESILAARTRDAFIIIQDAMKRFIIRDDFGMDNESEGNNTESSESDASYSTTELPESTEPATTEFSDMSTENSTESDSDEHKEEMLELSEIVEMIMQKSGMVLKGSRLEVMDIDELEYYGKLLRTLSPEVGIGIENITSIVDELSETKYYLWFSAFALESAYQVEESYSLMKDTMRISRSVMHIVEKLGENDVSSEVANFSANLKNFFEKSQKGFGYISRVDVDEAWENAFRFMASNNSNADTPSNFSEIVSLISESKESNAETHGFLSAHSYNYESVMASDSYPCDTSAVIQVWRISTASQVLYVSYNLLETLLSIKESLLSFPLIDNSTANDTKRQSSVFTDLYATLQTAKGDMTTFQFGLVQSMARFRSEIEMLLVDGEKVSSSTIESSLAIIDDSIWWIIGFNFVHGQYSQTSTRLIILNDAVGVLEHMASETRKWIEGICDNENCSSANNEETGNTTVTPGIGASMTTTTAMPTTIATTTLASTLAPNASEANDTDKDQKRFDEITDILMHWTFDSTSVKGQTVVQLKHFLEELKAYCSEVFGLHMWEQILLSTNMTLKEVLQNVYMTQIAHRVLLEESLFKYKLASVILGGYSDVLDVDIMTEEDYSYEEDYSDMNSTSDTSDESQSPEESTEFDESSDPGSSMPEFSTDDYSSPASPDNSTDIPPHPEDDGEEEQDGRPDKDDDKRDLERRFMTVVSDSLRIVEKWSNHLGILNTEMRELLDLIPELKELGMIKRAFLHSDPAGILRREVNIRMENVSSASRTLDEYHDELLEYSSHVMHISFFEQLEDLLQYSIMWLSDTDSSESSLNSTMASTGGSTDSGATTTPGETTVATTTTAAATGSTVTSTLGNYTDPSYSTDDDMDLSDIVDKLLESLRELRNMNQNVTTTEGTTASYDQSTTSTESGETTGEDGETTEIGETTGEDEEPTGGDGESIEENSFEEPQEEEKRTIMEGYLYEKFMYEELRERVYAFSRAMRQIEPAELDMFVFIVVKLEEATEIVGEHLEFLHSQDSDLMPATNVTMDYQGTNLTIYN
ncbi:hypothetical protein SK128_009571, partial [Halocaridina rubra]